MQIFDYDQVLLVPKKCAVRSRSECDTSFQLGPHRFRLPVVPANMRSVVDELVCLWLARHNYFYVMHRFDVDPIEFVKIMHAQGLFASISIGIQPADVMLVECLAQDANLHPEYVTVDVAHGHSDGVREMLALLKVRLPNAFVIAGNVATPEAVRDLESWGADAIKVGIGPGKVCTTKLKTGFGTGGWQLSAVQACAQVATKPLIADGGIRNHGDVAKSLRFGASFVMMGSLFAGLEESPGPSVEVDGKRYKEYFGSASEFNKHERKHVEGTRILEPVRGTLSSALKEMEEDLQSSISYAGGTTLDALKNVDYVVLNA